MSVWDDAHLYTKSVEPASPAVPISGTTFPAGMAGHPVLAPHCLRAFPAGTTDIA